MMKYIAKVLALSTLLVFVLSCGSSKSTNYELALITDVGTIDDKSFNQGSWEGLEEYALENNISHKYYQPAEKTTDAYIDAINLAVAAGAKVVVTPGFLFEPAVYVAQDTHKDVRFVLLDGTPQDGNNVDFRIEDNVYSVFYAEEQSGFLAGYAAVKDGYTNLGFIGGIAVPPVVRFGYGFVQGVEYAAKEMGLTDVTVKYTYVGDFVASPESQTLASSWYRSGTQIIFACAGGAGNSVMAAAEQNGGAVIGVDVDQSAESETVVTSAMKMLGNSVYMSLEDFYSDSFPGGQSVILDASSSGIGLPDNFSRFKKFSKEDYDVIYDKLINNEISILKDKDANTVKSIPVEITTIDLIN